MFHLNFNSLKDGMLVSIIAALSIGFMLLCYPHLGNFRSASVFQNFQLPPDGTLVQAYSDPRVYYMDGGKKRWVESRRAFGVQGFKDENIQIKPPNQVNQYEEGDPITVDSLIVLPGEAEVLPDLAPLAIYDIRLGKLNGRTVLKFSGAFWNQGKRAFELGADSSNKSLKDDLLNVYQRVISQDGTVRNKLVGNFLWHQLHVHYHYGDFAEYVFGPVKLPPGTPPPSTSAIRQKATFCLRDNGLIGPNLPGAPRSKVYKKCGATRQGVSVGWTDVYDYTLPDQYIDVHDMPAGIYSLSFLLDPNRHFVEKRMDNNISTVLIDMDIKKNKADVILAGAPFETGKNISDDFTLVRAGGTGAIYVLRNGKKRWLKNDDVFASYGFNWDSVYTLSQAIIDSIPSQILIRAENAAEVYALNPAGYKRHILSQEVLGSYEFTHEDIVPVNSTEFASYQDSKLIALSGTDQVYAIFGSTKQLVGALGSLASLGLNEDFVHVVNKVDFDAYTTTN